MVPACRLTAEIRYDHPLGAALQAARDLPGKQGEQLAANALDAFTSASGWALGTAAGLALAAAIIAYFKLPELHPRSPPDLPGETT